MMFSWPDLLQLLRQHFVTASFGISVLLVVFYWSTVKQKDHGLRRPPGPRPWPIIGNLALIGPLPHQDFQKLAKQYGPIFRLLLGSKETIIVSSPRMAEEILKTHDIAFASRPKLSQSRIMEYNNQTLVAAPYGPAWRDAKKLFTLELLSNRRIQQFQAVRREEVLSALHSMIEECNSGKVLHLSPKLKHLLMNNITRMMMNKTFFGPNSTADSSEANMVVENIEELLALSGAFVIGDYIPVLQPFDLQGYRKRMRAVAQNNDKFFQEIVDDRRQRLNASTQRNHEHVMDFIDVLLTRPTGNGEKPLTDTEIKAILQTVVIAGTDTSSVTVEWAMAELLRHPAVLTRAQDELDAIVGRDRLVEEDDIPNLKYMHCIMREVMRLHPTAVMTLPHECIESREVAGYHIPVKSIVFVNLYAIGRDHEVWENPLEFYPERFLSTSIDVHGQDFELLPFGSGRRMCPGKNLGLVLVEYMLAMFLHTCDWALPPGVSPEDVDMAEGPGVVLVMKTPLQTIASPRLPVSIIFGEQKSP
ncbi:unnamed protein product [Calypogeia fissa]